MKRINPKLKLKHKRTSYHTGIVAEQMAVWALRLKGYRILAQRYKSRYGEIDIIARHKNALVFIEVKARQGQDEALCAVTHKMKSRIERAASDYIARHPAVQTLSARFDFIAIAPPFFFRHLDNAWRPVT